ncbi:MAG: GLPGLI family protein [Ferruginibacter sp.]|nr:GLPGLI family protein [Ferruginibacter sp.]
MRLILILLLFYLVVFKIGVAQNSTNIIYTRHLYKLIPDGKIAPDESFTRLSFNDSLAYYYYFDDYFKKVICSKKKLGNKLLHHSSYIKYNKGYLITYETVAWPLLGKKYLIEDTVQFGKWTYTNKTKQILNYDCKMAYRVEYGSKDTTLIWYTEKLEGNFGPPEVVGHHGVVLEVINQKYGIHEFAKEISNCSTVVVFPENVQNVPSIKYQKIKENKTQVYKFAPINKSFVKQLKLFQIL